ncbi:hypothetical protein VTO73DRAFT_1527 [Trametes versicolor]
MKWGMFCGHI